MNEHLPVPQQPPALSAELLETIEAARRFEDLSRAANTRRAYRSDWSDFAAYCSRHSFPILPSSDRAVELYITYLAHAWKPPLNPASIGRRLAAIAHYHRDAGYLSPTDMAVVKKAWAGIRKSLRIKPKPKKAVVSEELLRILPDAESTRAIDVRDRAVLLLGFSAALRRSEIVALHRADLAFEKKGVVVTIQYSKTNQEGEPERVAVEFLTSTTNCPVVALLRWLNLANISDGPAFRRIDRHGNIASEPLSPAAVAEIVKRAAERAGLDPRHVAAHSLRSGFVTTSRRRGLPDWAIQRHTRHKSPEMLNRYTHSQTLWDQNPSGDLGL